MFLNAQKFDNLIGWTWKHYVCDTGIEISLVPASSSWHSWCSTSTSIVLWTTCRCYTHSVQHTHTHTHTQTHTHTHFYVLCAAKLETVLAPAQTHLGMSRSYTEMHSEKKQLCQYTFICVILFKIHVHCTFNRKSMAVLPVATSWWTISLMRSL